VFGELYFLLEYRDSSISLQYSPDKEFTLPQNLFLIGAMNTADRSIARIDTALRRRFSFAGLDPRLPPVHGLLARWLSFHNLPNEPARLLDTGCARMLSVPRVDSESQRMLRDFGDVTVIPHGSPVPLWEPSRLNARYHPALRLASLVVDATSVEHQAGNVAVNGFLLDMPSLFEQSVTVALREAITARFGGRVEGQVRYYLDQARQVPLRPDIVWKTGGTTAAVIDAKYKAEKPAGYPNADLYQLLAYCTILGLPAGHLIYARGTASPARHVIQQAGIEIRCHAIDLNQPPEQPIAQMSNLAEVVTATAT
jgi:5-methylcytosine-specific restriction enzyme subunit McrC